MRMPTNATREEYLARYDILAAWRAAWLGLANDVERARAERRTTLKQERIERRAVQANHRIAALMAAYDAHIRLHSAIAVEAS